MLLFLSLRHISIIASGGAGKKEDFLELFRNHPAVDAGLAASIFHPKQVEICLLYTSAGWLARSGWQ